MKHAALIIALFTASQAVAYDFAMPGSDGRPIYYDITQYGVEVTFCDHFVPTPDYSGIVTIPSSIDHDGSSYRVVSIGRHAFYGCDITGIHLPSSISDIKDFAFSGCTQLSSVDIPGSVEHLGQNIFDGCFSLTDINVAGSNQSYKSIDGAVYDRSGSTLISYPQGREDEAHVSPNLKAIGHGAFYGCSFLSHIYIPDGVTTLSDNAFYFCNGLTSVTLPASVEDVGRGVLADCLNLESIDVDDANPCFTSVDGCLLNKDASVLMQSPAAKSGDAAVPPTVAEISDLAFFRSYGIASAVLPESLVKVHDGAFVDCQSLTAVSLPASIREIGDMAFALCPSLQSVHVRSILPSEIKIGEDAFTGINSDSCILYVPAGSLQAYEEADGWSAFSNIIEYESLSPQYISWDTEYKLAGYDMVTLALDAEASSGLPVTYTLSPESLPIASISGNRLTMPSNARVTITATQNGNEHYTPAPAVTRTIAATDHIDSATSDYNIRIYSTPGSIIISGAPVREVARVYDTDGHTVYSGLSRNISVAGDRIYIVYICGKSYKVLVRQ